MLMDMALNKQRILLGIQAAGNILGQLLQGTPAQVCGILPHSNGMQIRHKVETVKLICPLSPILHSAQIRAQGQITGGLDAGEHSFLCCNFFHNNTSLTEFFSF